MSKLDQNINSGCYRCKRPDARIYYKDKWWCKHCIDKLEDKDVDQKQGGLQGTSIQTFPDETPLRTRIRQSAETWAETFSKTCAAIYRFFTKERTIQQSASTETWKETFSRTFESIFRIFSKDENRPPAKLSELHQDQPSLWVPPPPPDPPNPH
ncbi:uncharacterized protein LOC143081916 [Mytilus galloprovincialis]|uniref:uncharacterized protein LOC143081916 n=1 Tax=Mytilus galloprovincialis TaxID=29158 RepID=UPI003F7BF0C4